MTQITANLMEKTLQLTVPVVTVLALDGLTKKHFGHYALLKTFSLGSPINNAADKNNVAIIMVKLCIDLQGAS